LNGEVIDGRTHSMLSMRNLPTEIYRGEAQGKETGEKLKNKRRIVKGGPKVLQQPKDIIKELQYKAKICDVFC
jgi:hypothetical protein